MLQLWEVPRKTAGATPFDSPFRQLVFPTAFELHTATMCARTHSSAQASDGPFGPIDRRRYSRSADTCDWPQPVCGVLLVRATRRPRPPENWPRKSGRGDEGGRASFSRSVRKLSRRHTRRASAGRFSIALEICGAPWKIPRKSCTCVASTRKGPDARTILGGFRVGVSAARPHSTIRKDT